MQKHCSSWNLFFEIAVIKDVKQVNISSFKTDILEIAHCAFWIDKLAQIKYKIQLV